MSWGVATQNGVSVSLASIVSLSCGATAFSPQSLFTSGVQGAWYDPSDLTTLFQDAAGTTPVTAAGQTVKRWNDKSGNANHLSNTAATWTYQVDSSGNPYVQTDGSNYLQLASGTNWTWTTGTATLSLAIKPNTAGLSKDICGVGSVVSSTNVWSCETFSGGMLMYRRGSGSFGGRGSTTIGTTTTTFVTTLDLSGATQATENAYFTTNGVSPTLTNYGAGDTGGGTFSVGRFRLGSGGSGNNFFTGRIYQLVLTAVVESAQNLSNLETYCGSKAGYVIPYAVAATPVFLDTFTPVNETGYVRTSPFSRARYTTTAEEISVFGYSTVSGAFPSLDSIAVYSNGTFVAAIDPTANGAFNGNVSLSPGAKTIEFVAGTQSSPTQSASAVLGTWFTGASASASMTAVSSSPTNRLVVYGDSISVGANSTVPPRDAWAVLVRTARGTASTVVDGYGYRSLYLDASSAGVRASFVAAIQALSPSILWNAIGTNDYGLNKWSAADFGTAYAAVLDDLHAAMPSLVIYCQTPIVRTSEVANTYGNTLGDYRSVISTAVSSRTSFCTLVDGTAILTTADLADGVHPTTAGHALYATYVNTVLGV